MIRNRLPTPPAEIAVGAGPFVNPNRRKIPTTREIPAYSPRAPEAGATRSRPVWNGLLYSAGNPTWSSPLFGLTRRRYAVEMESAITGSRRSFFPLWAERIPIRFRSPIGPSDASEPHCSPACGIRGFPPRAGQESSIFAYPPFGACTRDAVPPAEYARKGVRGEAAVAQGADRPARRPQDARRAGGIGRRARRGRRRADDRGRGDSSSCLPPRSRFATAAASRRPCASTAFHT